MNFHSLLGMAGVAKREVLLARTLGLVFEYCLLAIILILALQWYAELQGLLHASTRYWINCGIWSFFLIEVLTLGSLVKNKTRYFRENWGYLLILILGVPLLWDLASVVEVFRYARFFLLLWLLLPWIDTCQRTLTDNKLGTTILTVIAMMVVLGIIISGLDPAFKSPWDGIWWAWVTVSTVGYGDIVPHSLIGRLFASALILMGLGLFAVLTANFSAIFVRRRVGGQVDAIKRESADIRSILKSLGEVKKEEDDILALLKNIDARLIELEKKSQSD